MIPPTMILSPARHENIPVPADSAAIHQYRSKKLRITARARAADRRRVRASARDLWQFPAVSLITPARNGERGGKRKKIESIGRGRGRMVFGPRNRKRNYACCCWHTILGDSSRIRDLQSHRAKRWKLKNERRGNSREQREDSSKSRESFGGGQLDRMCERLPGNKGETVKRRGNTRVLPLSSLGEASVPGRTRVLRLHANVMVNRANESLRSG